MEDQSKKFFDVIVVGSGASGGWASKRLSEAGLKVTLVEAGRPQADTNFTEHKAPFELKYRNRAPEVIRKTRPVQSEVCSEYNYMWYCNDLEEPYTTPSGKPFIWTGRLRMVGGRTNVWGRHSYRLSDLDFKAASFDGYGEDWPLSYKDLAQYYDLVEEYVGISGNAEGLEELPDGRFHPPMGLTCAEVLLRNRVKKKLGWTVTVGRVANITRPLRGRAVVLCAQALESVRILLNSANRQYPKGLANSSGVLGHYLMDHVYIGGGASGEFPGLPGKPSLDGPNRPNGLYVPRFRNTLKSPRTKNFLRGYGFQGGGEVYFNWNAPGYGAAYKQAVRVPVWKVGLGGFGECLPRWENRVEINPNVKDIFGIPALHIDMAYGENERAMIEDMAVTAAEMLETAGAKNIRPFTVPSREPGRAIHEVGVARMGHDPKRSVLNQFQQTHDIKNLFVMDGAGFTSSACQNPTLTIMALAVRSCDYLMGEMKCGNI